MSRTEKRARGYLCASDSLETGGLGFRFEVHSDGEVVSAFAVRHSCGVSAFINRCGHRDLELDWSPGEFFDLESRWLICATHGALYDPKTGVCRGGPCNGTPLTAIGVIEESGGIYLVDPRYHVRSDNPETTT
ncbi:MAG TPA: (2Fe-2S)-binding protein [Gammaproteobacteria bacterium]|nr:(2Fe-2S)-binding protein [Gammaproteobacteria bacterium]